MKKLNNELDQESPDQPISFYKRLTDAAIEECNRCNKVLKEEPLTSDMEWNEPDFSVGYKHGVKSDIAKEYWLEQFMLNNETYTKNEVIDMLFKFDKLIHQLPAPEKRVLMWFEQNKKK